MESRMSRRDFLRVSTLTAAGLVLSACATPTTAPAPAPAATTAPAGGPAPTAAAARETIEITIGRSQHALEPIINDAPAHLAAGQANGMRLNFSVVPESDWVNKQKLWLSTKQLPDLLFCKSQEIRDYQSPEVLKPLLGLIDKHGPNLKRYLAAYPNVKKVMGGNELYYIPQVTYNWKYLAPMPVIRKDLVEKAGLKIPETWDDLITVIKEVKKANPGMTGWTNRNGTRWFLSLVTYPMGSGYGATQAYFGPYYDPDQKKWLFGPIHDEFKEILGYFARAWKEGVFDPDLLTATPDQWREKNGGGKGIFGYDNYFFCSAWNKTLREKDPKAAWSPIPSLKNKNIRRGVNYDGFYDGWAISAASKYPERIIQLLDWMITPIGLDTTNWGIEGTHYTLKAPRVERVDDYSFDGLSKAMDPAKKQMVPAIYEKYKAKSDPVFAFRGELGVGQLDFTVAFDSWPTYAWDAPGEGDAWYDLSIKESKEKILRGRALQPPFTPAESERIKKLLTDVDTVTVPAFDKVILGQMTLAEYDKVIADAKKAGAEELEKIYNDAEARVA